MAYQYYNPNPMDKHVGDCVIRSIAKVTDQDWDKTYLGLVMQGFMMRDMPSSNAVWGAYLYNQGFQREVIPNTCPDCYSIEDFVNDNPSGTYLLATGSHVVAVENGDYFDTWDSGKEIPVYYWRKE